MRATLHVQGFPWYLIAEVATSQLFKTASPKNAVITASHVYIMVKILESPILEEPKYGFEPKIHGGVR